METVTTKPRMPFSADHLRYKALKLNGSSAIESCVARANQQGSLFLEEDKLVFIINGFLKIKHGQREYLIGKNQMAFLRKDIFIEIQTLHAVEDPEEVEYILFSLQSEVIKDFTKLVALSTKINEESPAVAISMMDMTLVRYIDSLESCFIEPENVEGSLIKIKLLELLFYLLKYNNRILDQLLYLREHFRSNITSTVEENLLNSLSLNQLAVLCGRSLSSFRRDFLAIYNMPPSQWIRQKRLEKSQELLLNTAMKITDICYETGFENIAHFSRLFKTHYGYSPSEFRFNTAVA